MLLSMKWQEWWKNKRRCWIKTDKKIPRVRNQAMKVSTEPTNILLFLQLMLDLILLMLNPAKNCNFKIWMVIYLVSLRFLILAKIVQLHFMFLHHHPFQLRFFQMQDSSLLNLARMLKLFGTISTILPKKDLKMRCFT